MSHLIAAPDDVSYSVFILQQLAQLSGPQSGKVRHDARGMLSASSVNFAPCLFHMHPAGALWELIMLRLRAVGKLDG